MLTKSLCSGMILFLALAQPTNEEKAKKDLEKMQGAWTMQALEVNGKDVPMQKLEGTVLNVKGDEYRTTVKDKEQPGFRIKLDPSKDPKAIDMIKKEPDGSEKVYKGIYVVEKDQFKMCRPLEANQDRPNQFGTWPDTGYFVVTWKKK